MGAFPRDTHFGTRSTLRVCASVALLAAASPGALVSQRVCAAGATAALDSAWRLLRADSLPHAGRLFARALHECPGASDARVGLGFLGLRTGDVSGADTLFRTAIQNDSTNSDAWEGAAMVAERRGNMAVAIAATRRVLVLAPTYESARARLLRLAPDDERPQTDRAARRYPELNLTMRTQGDRFELRDSDRWRDFFVRGVNLGLAYPGRFPAEFPTDSSLFARWFEQIAEMNANALRVYTILPPQFYRALRAWNLARPGRPLYVIHGVWTELPPDENFDDPEFSSGFRDEMRRVVDLLHGAADFPPQPGHAGGRYDADVSPWTIGYIIGREWESHSIFAYLAQASGERHYDGRFLELPAGSAIDAWMAAQCDHLLAYEHDTYNSLRPIAYTNWPTTDPLNHPSESSFEQQMKLRGLRWMPEPGAPPPYDEDNVSLDANLVKATASNPAGWFASYHVYPYYPDFLLNDEAYSKAASSMGRSNYFGYLTALKRHHHDMPIMISEFSVPTSRGVAHLHPQGWNHGGLNETDAAVINARLAAEIREAGAAGEVFFAWIDEWFKANWFSADFEIPDENRRQWHNILSPEQHYGIIALRPGAAAATPLPGGSLAPWRQLPLLQQGPLFGNADSTMMRVGNDEGFVYIVLETRAFAGMQIHWDTLRLQLAIDTYKAELGQFFLPGSGLRSEAGFEFLLELRGPADAQLLVTPEYNPYVPDRLATGGDRFGEHFRRPIFSRRRADAQFDSLYTLTNRPRYARDGRLIPGAGVNLGRLAYGKASENSLADWYVDAPSGMIQIRLPWGMLNVSDPSTNSVLFESDTALALHPPSDTCPPCSRLVGMPSDGFRFAAVALRPGPQLSGSIPGITEYGRLASADFRTWKWKPWTQPTWHEYAKPTYAALRDLWAQWK